MTFYSRDGLVYKLEGGGTIGAEFLELLKPENDQDPHRSRRNLAELGMVPILMPPTGTTSWKWRRYREPCILLLAIAPIWVGWYQSTFTRVSCFRTRNFSLMANRWTSMLNRPILFLYGAWSASSIGRRTSSYSVDSRPFPSSEPGLLVRTGSRRHGDGERYGHPGAGAAGTP
jgi:hypothetical protein